MTSDRAPFTLLATLVASAGRVAVRPILGRLAVRNIARRKGRVLIVIAGLLVGTAIISSSLVVGDTLSYVFVGDVYTRLDAIDELVVNEFNGNLLSFPESYADGIAAGLASRGSPVDGVAPVLLKVMPVRNAAGDAGSQEVSVLGLNESREDGFGRLVALDGRPVSTDDLGPLEVLANERAASQLNATPGQELTLFYGTTNETIVYASLVDVVRDEGKAAYERRPILFMDLRAGQAAFNETGRINLVKVSNEGDAAGGAAHSADVAIDLVLIIGLADWELRVDRVKADGIEQAIRFGADATELFLVMGAFSIIAGILLIVNIFVMLAEERRPEMGISRAVGFLRRDLLWAFTLEGTLYVVLAAALGALAGLGLGYGMVLVFDRIVPHGDVQVAFHFEPGSVLLAFAAGAALTWTTVLLASWRASRLNIVRAIRDLPEPVTTTARSIPIASAAFLVGGVGLTAWGALAGTGHGLIPGPPLIAYGAALLGVRAGHPRAGFSGAAAFALAWILAPFGLLNESTDNVSAVFVVSGIILVASAILLAVFNVSEVLRAVLSRAEGGIGRPVLRTAVSYPLEKRFRTAMTVTIFALILFMVTLVSMVQGMQESSLEGFVAQQSGGYDVIAYTTTYGEIPGFRDILWGNFSPERFRGGQAGVSTASVMPARVQELGQNRSYDYTLWGVDNFLVESNEYGFHDHLPAVVDESGTRRDLTTREDVWRSLEWNHSLAIVDRSASGPNQFVPDENRLRVDPGDRIRVLDPAGRTVELTIVGVLEQALQFTSGVFVDESVVKGTFPEEERYTAYFFQVAPGVDVRALRADLERVFFPYGLRTIDIREEIGEAFDASQQVLTLLQAYLGIGLLAGIAGLAVVTLRAVVERRQQVGTLRAIGFTRRMVVSVFLLEIALVSVLGVSIGVGLGIVFAWKVHAVYFADIVVFTVPVVNLVAIVGLASLAAVACTAQPAFRAARVPPADALRFVE